MELLLGYSTFMFLNDNKFQIDILYCFLIYICFLPSKNILRLCVSLPFGFFLSLPKSFIFTLHSVIFTL